MSDQQAESIIQILSIQNPFTQSQVAEGIQSWPKTLQQCKHRAHLFKSFQTSESPQRQTLQEKFDKLTLLAHTVEPLLRESTETELEGYSQVFFQGTPWSQINSIPFALVILSFYKSFIVPAFSIVLPLLSWILPYILLRVFYNIPIGFTEYTGVLWRMWNGQPMPKNPQELLLPLPPMPQEDAMTQLRRLAQNGWTLFTLGQAIWQPIQQARHFMRLDSTCIQLGNDIIEIKKIAGDLLQGWRGYLPHWLPSWLAECPSDARQAFAFVQEVPFWLPHTFRSLGRFEILYRLASRSDVVPTEFLDSAKPVLMLKDFGDPSIATESRIVSSIGLGKTQSKTKSQSHAILTGPNRGGKSSFMRGILTNIILSHAFGAAFAGKAQMSHFTWIANGLRLDDTPGKQSMFEREVAFASAVLNKTSGKGILLYDELFHSTNPPDAIRTSELFCNDLWKKENCLSIVSTHVYSLARSAPEKLVKPICVAAWDLKDQQSSRKSVEFSYTVQKGVCEVSSVDLVLKQYGMI